MTEPGLTELPADLLSGLRRLDRLLSGAVAAAEQAYGAEAAADPYRGLYVGQAEVTRLLARAPGKPLLQPERDPSRSTAEAPGGSPAAARRAAVPAAGLGALLGGLRGGRGGGTGPSATPPATDDGGASRASGPAGWAAEPGPEPAGSMALDEFAPDGALGWLARAFGLTGFELDLVLVALAPELDLRYERLYAYLQDDVSRRRPSVDLALNLLCASPADKLAGRRRLAPDAPLRRRRLLRLVSEGAPVQSPLLAQTLKLDDQVVRLLLGDNGLDERLAPYGELVSADVDLELVPVRDEVRRVLPPLVAQARANGRPLRLYFRGPKGAGKRRAAEGLAAAVGAPLLAMDLGRVVANDAALDELIPTMLREASFRGALLYVDGLDALRQAAGPQEDRLLAALQADAGVTILAGAEPWAPWGHGPLGVMELSFAIPEHEIRRACWEANLAQVGKAVTPAELDTLAGRFQLTPDQIAEAVVGGYQLARSRLVATAAATPGYDALATVLRDPAAVPGALTTVDLFAAARAQAGHNLGALAQRIDTRHGWADIVLPETSLSQLRQICEQVAHRHQVLEDWGFGRRLSLGTGLSALFAGPSGTGKTMAAEILAGELGLEIYRIDLSGVVSKYIGETEKNLDRIFGAAEHANAILLFDEADALFGKRSEVRDAHDRYANIETAYLLQKMEQFEGVAILATNLRQNMDEAFVRRLQYIVEFPFPDEAQRREIWRILFPAEAPRDAAVDLTFLARQFRLSGGNIKNVVLAAAYLAAAAGEPIGMPHLIAATRREYQKLGKVVPEVELNGHHPASTHAGPGGGDLQ